MSEKPLAISTLRHLTKDQLIDRLLLAQQNIEGLEERLNQQFENCTKIINDYKENYEPVIHCKDCEWKRFPRGCPFRVSGMKDSKGNLPHDDDYCSRAEKIGKYF